MITEERKQQLSDNYLKVAEKIEEAVRRRGGDRPVSLLAATKTVPEEEIEYLIEKHGLSLCGENHAQEFRDKYSGLSAAGARVDFIGHLQTNKVKYVAGRAGLIHSLDSVRIAEAIQAKCERDGTVQPVLIEVNMGGEETKTGIPASFLEPFMEEIGRFDRLELRGMMTMVPKSDDPSEVRKYFRQSYRLFIDNFGKKLHNTREVVLSMGMSDSFECAIEEGADIVRVGSALFGARRHP